MVSPRHHIGPHRERTDKRGYQGDGSRVHAFLAIHMARTKPTYNQMAASDQPTGSRAVILLSGNRLPSRHERRFIRH